MENAENTTEQTCAWCRDKIQENDGSTTTTQNEIICQDCADNYLYTCDDCSASMHCDDANFVNDNAICNDCYSDNYTTCDGCGNNLHIDDSHYSDSDNYSYCIDCYNRNEDEDTENIDTNLYKYCDLSKNLKNKKLLPVAVEIEAENGYFCDAQNEIEKLNIGAGVTKDGSLNNTGIEIQLAPAQITIQRKNLKLVTKTLLKNGYKPTIKCGLHAHIGLNGSTDKQLVNIVKTFSCLEDVFFALVPPSRRSNNYCHKLAGSLQYYNIKNKTDFNDILRKFYSNGNKYQLKKYHDDKVNIKEHYKNKRYNEARYNWFNLHSYIYRNTIEIRIHQGSLNANKITNWLVFLLKLANYARFNYSNECMDYINSLETPEQKLKATLRIIKASKTLRKNMLNRYKTYNKNNQIVCVE